MWHNKTRSFLTMLGIIIGISSVIILVGIGQGTQKSISDQIENLGTNLITVNVMGRRTATLTDAEIIDLKTKPGIKEIAPMVSQSVTVKAGDISSTTTLEASTPNYSEVKKATVSQGRFITQRDIDNRYNVAVIGTDTAETLFSTTNAVGKTIYINGIGFSIVGVLTTQGTSSAGSGDDKIIVPLTTGERLLKSAKPTTFYVEANSQDEVDIAMSYLQLFLNKKYKLSNDSTTQETRSYYRVMSQTSLLSTATSTTQSMTAMLAGIAAISLLVGGIGIMNIMLVSVIERTREIGTRKAIGAKRRTILFQFLIESCSISAIGGILGVLAGYLGAFIATKYFRTTVLISGEVVLAAFAFSAIVGVIFGMYPASKASKLNPIDALRYE